MDQLDELRRQQQAMDDIYALMAHLVRVRLSGYFTHYVEEQLRKRIKRITIRRIVKLLKITHARGNNPIRALYWMNRCGGVRFVGEMTPEWRQWLDYAKAMGDVIEHK